MNILARPTCPGPNEVYVSCKNPCPDTCDVVTGMAPRKMCMPMNPCPSGCDCISGYVRDKNNKCIKKEDCRRFHKHIYLFYVIILRQIS